MELTNREAKVLKLFSTKMDLTHLDQIKLIYGWRLFIAYLKKLIFMYGFAFLLGCFIETLLIHAAFFTFRQVAFGAHGKNFYICLITSCIVFPKRLIYNDKLFKLYSITGTTTDEISTIQKGKILA